MSVKKFLTEQFLEALDRTEIVTKIISLGLTPKYARLSYLVLEEKLSREWDGGKIRKAVEHLIHSGYLKRGQKSYFLTAKSLRKILELRIRKKIENRRRTRNKYLVLIFDIPEDRRRYRDLFRRHLREMGFERIQQSVWITRYDILGELKELIGLYEVEEFVKFFVAEKA